jgi:hypothetical protein
MKTKIFLLLLCSLLVMPALAQKKMGQLSGDLQQWHRVTITFDGPGTGETATPNPFRDYRLNVTFTNGNRKFVVAGFYAADGNAGESSATAGNKWRVHFMPDAVGEWRYAASFRSSSDVALSTEANAGKAVAFDGASGTFTVTASGKTGVDFRGKEACDMWASITCNSLAQVNTSSKAAPTARKTFSPTMNSMARLPSTNINRMRVIGSPAIQPGKTAKAKTSSAH